MQVDPGLGCEVEGLSSSGWARAVCRVAELRSAGQVGHLLLHGQSSYAGSMVASSTSMIGILSRTGYTRRHSLHFKLVPSSFWINGFLHTGQTRISIKSFSIIEALYPEY